ncbi:MAG TPA: glycosyl hydrolase family 18 protein [Buttiauxella sp.]|jgi:chitinase
MKLHFKKNTVTLGLLLSSVMFCGNAFAGDAASTMPDISNKNILFGFWHNWPAGEHSGYQQGTPAEMNLSETPVGYNVVAVAFMKGEGIPTFKPYNVTDQQFRDQIGALNKQDRAVLISLGGADAHIELHKGQEAAFANEIIRLVDTYGFDGIDLDLEQAAIMAGDNQTVIPAALKQVKQHYRDLGMNFIISMAPEFPYLRTGGNYAKYITALEGDYDFIAPQYYNQGGDGLWVDELNLWLTQNNDERKADFLYYLTDSLVHGTRGFIKIPADKFVIGLPSNIDAAATGYVKKESDVRTAFEKLAANGNPIKGLMTWSVNWDAGRSAAGNGYGNEFVNRYASLINDNNPGEPDDVPPTVPGTPVAEAGSDYVSLSWAASTDNVGVAQYEIWRDGVKIATSATAAFIDAKVAPQTTYLYSIIAVDKAGNRSAASQELQVTTTAKDATGDEWSSTKIYLGGDRVKYQGKQYQAKWWTRGDIPGQSDVWALQ